MKTKKEIQDRMERRRKIARSHWDFFGMYFYPCGFHERIYADYLVMKQVIKVYRSKVLGKGGW